jgi:hypothetical protein
MHLVDGLPLAIFTMILGAVLGAVLPPFGDALTNLVFRKRSRGLHSALLLFFAASGIWVIAEILVELFVRTATDKVDVATATVVASIFGLAAVTFAMGFRHLPKRDKTTDYRLSRALLLLILGNIFWIIGETLETFTWALWPSEGLYAQGVHVFWSVIAVSVFAAGALAAWRSTAPKAAHNDQASTPSRSDIK